MDRPIKVEHLRLAAIMEVCDAWSQETDVGPLTFPVHVGTVGPPPHYGEYALFDEGAERYALELLATRAVARMAYEQRGFRLGYEVTSFYVYSQGNEMHMGFTGRCPTSSRPSLELATLPYRKVRERCFGGDV